jgi:transposase
MLDVDTRTAVLRLRDEGHGYRTIARALGISRNAVRRVIDSGVAEVPSIEKESQLDEHADTITELYAECAGNLVRVSEELVAKGVKSAYSTLTAWCRRRGLGQREKKRAGRYHFEPGEEMQHDTSPHDVRVGGRMRRLQCAAVVLFFSRLLFMQLYPRFTRFWCKVFMTEAAEYYRGVAKRCMVDNTSVVVACGTGSEAVMAPEMEAFAKRLGFEFAAHEKGDANRSARVERAFWYVERNFYPGRTFVDLADLNRQAVAWCDKTNKRFIRTIRAVPIELYQRERVHLKPLPIHVPEVTEEHRRSVDLEGYVRLHGGRYSAPAELIGRWVQVRESKARVRIFDGHREVAVHDRLEDGTYKRSTLPEHRKRGLWRKASRAQPEPMEEERVLRTAGEALGRMADELRRKHGGRAAGYLRRLHRMYLDYPTDVLNQAVSEALEYGLLDLKRIERMVLRKVAGKFFRLGKDQGEEG